MKSETHTHTNTHITDPVYPSIVGRFVRVCTSVCVCVCACVCVSVNRFRELSELTRKHQEAVSQLSARLAELDSDNRKLRDNKYELDTRVRAVHTQTHSLTHT